MLSIIEVVVWIFFLYCVARVWFSTSMRVSVNWIFLGVVSLLVAIWLRWPALF